MGHAASGPEHQSESGAGPSSWRCDTRTHDAANPEMVVSSVHGGHREDSFGSTSGHGVNDHGDGYDVMSYRSGSGGGSYEQGSVLSFSQASYRSAPRSDGGAAHRLKDLQEKQWRQEEDEKQRLLTEFKRQMHRPAIQDHHYAPSEAEYSRAPRYGRRGPASDYGGSVCESEGQYTQQPSEDWRNPHWETGSAYSDLVPPSQRGGGDPRWREEFRPNQGSGGPSARTGVEVGGSVADEAAIACDPEANHSLPYRRDLEAKLTQAEEQHRKMGEELQKAKEQADVAQQELKREKASKTTSNEVERLMIGRVSVLNDHVQELEKTAAEKQATIEDLDTRLREVEEKKEQLSQQKKELTEDREKMKKDMETKQNKMDDLEEKNRSLNIETQRLRDGLHKISIERDETLELLEKAVKQKDQLKKGRNVDVEQARLDLEALQESRARDQKEVQRLLSTIDQVLATSEKYNSVDAAQSELQLPLQHELVKIRDGMRQLNLSMRNQSNPGGGPGGGGSQWQGQNPIAEHAEKPVKM